MATLHLPGVPIFLVGVGPKRVSSGGRQRQRRRPTPPLGGHSQPIRAANHIPRRTRARPHGVNTPPFSCTPREVFHDTLRADSRHILGA